MLNEKKLVGADAICDLTHDFQVMADEDAGKAGAGADILEDVQHLRLHGNIEG